MNDFIKEIKAAVPITFHSDLRVRRDTIQVIFIKVKLLAKKHPNDAELGAVIRQLLKENDENISNYW